VARSIVLRAFLLLPIAFVAAFLLAPLGLTIAVSFWRRVGLSVRPAFVFVSYLTFFDSVRFAVLARSLLVSIEATVLSLFISFPLAAAMSTVVVLVMAVLLMGWYLVFDMQSFLGKVLSWRA
jgi:spermidine/putrescine transport system permease protein